MANRVRGSATKLKDGEADALRFFDQLLNAELAREFARPRMVYLSAVEDEPRRTKNKEAGIDEEKD